MARRKNPFGIEPIKIEPIDLSFGPKKNKRDPRRAFTRTQKNEIWAQQKGRCAICHKPLDPRTVEYDHGKAWSAGGPTKIKNGRALCPNCHKLKTHKERLKKVEKKKRKKEYNPFEIKIPKIKF